MSMLLTPHQNRNICDEIEIKVEGRKKTMQSKKCLPRSDVDDRMINSTLVELEKLLGTYCYGIPVSRLSWLERGYLQMFNKSLDYESLDVNNIKELVEIMRDKGMVLWLQEPESKKLHVMSARLVQVRQNDSLKPNVQTLLDRNSGLIEFISFEDLYERQFNVKLNYFQYGLTDLDHLCDVLKDILMVRGAYHPGAKVITAKTRNDYSKKQTCLPSLDVDFLIDQRLFELEKLLGTYCYGIPLCCLFWLERVYLLKFNKSLHYKSLGVNNLLDLVEIMRDKGMVLWLKEPGSNRVHVMSAHMVKARQNDSLKPNVRALLAKYPRSIEFISFEDSYERRFNLKLNYFQYGLTDLDDLCKVLKDILMVKEADPTGAKVIKAKKGKYRPKKKNCLRRLDVAVLIDQILVELEESLATFTNGLPVSRLSDLESRYTEKFNKSLDYNSLGVINIEELVKKMPCKAMVVWFIGSEGEHVMSARMVAFRQVFLKRSVKKLLRRNSGEIKFESFEDLYNGMFRGKLNYTDYGLADLDDLCKALKDILVVEEANPSRVKVIKAVKNDTIPPQSVCSSSMTNTNTSTLSSDTCQKIQQVLGGYYLGISLSRWSMFEYCYNLKFNESLESLGVTSFTRLLHEMGKERVVVFAYREWEEEYVMSARVANFRRETSLKPNVEKLLTKHGGKIEFDSFENSYEDQFKDTLFYGYYGLSDLHDLCENFKTILEVTEEKGKKVIKAVGGHI